MKYRKKPVVIDAFRWTADEHQEEDPQWIVDAIERGEVFFKGSGTDDVALCIKTLEGVMSATRGDYIIRGVKGEIYPCKPDIFEATYEAVSPPIQLPRSDSGKYPPEVAHMLKTGRAVVRDEAVNA